MTRREAASWAALVALTAAASLLLGLAHIPSPTLMAALLVGVGWALKAPGPALTPPRPVGIAAEAVVGVAIGAYVQLETLEALGADLPAVLVANVVTLVLSVAAGIVLARVADVDEPTAAFGMVAGGASGIVAMADDLGADARQVAVMQYVRVLVIVLLTPVLAAIVFGAGQGGGGGVAVTGDVSAVQGLLFCAVAMAVGIPPGLRFPAGTVLAPMVVAAALTIAGVPFAGAVPAALQDVAFAVIGLAVGLRFTPASIRAAGRILPPALALIGALLVLCAATGAILAPLAGVSQLTAYLATTPGGLYAVLATAVDSDADATFVLAVQVLRLFVMLLAAPLLARRLRRAARPRRG